ncbi:MAG: peptide chain release factor N(5)-glutamine methyltransferase [Gemmatimonadales bacterium]
MIDARPMIGELLAAATDQLERAGIDDPRREALRIWSGLEGSPVAGVVLQQRVLAAPEQAIRFDEAVRRRAAGEPLAYVTGWTGFRHLTLRCDRRALIPRPETEGLVEAALARVHSGTAADIGTGTGAIALALQDEGAFQRVFATELSPEAMALAAENIAAAGNSVTLLAGDLVAPLAGQSVDLLVANPPYLTEAEYDTLDRSVRDYEPAIALVGGPDGLLLIRRLLAEARDVVAAGGWIALEVDTTRAHDCGRLAEAAGWLDVTVLDDLFGRARYLLARRGKAA